MFPIIALVLFSLSYSIFVVWLYASVPKVVHKDAIGTGYGIVTACQFFGITISPLFGLLINEESESIEPCLLVIFTASSFVAALISIFMLIVDFIHTKRSSGWQKIEHDNENSQDSDPENDS